MYGLARRRRPGALVLASFGLVTASALFAACGAAPPRTGRGRHPGGVTTSPGASAAAAEEPKKPFPELAELAGMAVVGELRSSHPVGDLEAVIHANGGAAGYGKRGRAPITEGALLVESLSSERGGLPHLHYVMRRRAPGYFAAGGDWEYAVVGPDGLVEAQGRLGLCARCHAEAQRDFLFEPDAPL